jgi:hypothetical protein
LTSIPNLLRDSFSAVSARFHLAGLFALAILVIRFSTHWTGDDPTGLPLMLVALVVYIAVDSGVYGLLFQAAMTPREPLSFARWAAALFLPLLWLLFKIGLVQAWFIALAATVHQLITGGPVSASLDTIMFWGRPLFDLLTQILALYSQPLCVLSRVRREWRPHLREGIKVYRDCPADSRRILLLLILITAMESAVRFALGPQAEKAPPGPVEGLVTLASAYLTLVTYFAASRVVLARFATRPGAVFTEADRAAPSPQA